MGSAGAGQPHHPSHEPCPETHECPQQLTWWTGKWETWAVGSGARTARVISMQQARACQGSSASIHHFRPYRGEAVLREAPPDLEGQRWLRLARAVLPGRAWARLPRGRGDTGRWDRAQGHARGVRAARASGTAMAGWAGSTGSPAAGGQRPGRPGGWLQLLLRRPEAAVDGGGQTGAGGGPAASPAPTVMGRSAASRMSSILSSAKASRACRGSRFLNPVRLIKWILSQLRP